VKTRKFAKLSDPIEVVQFEGGQENGAEIVAWVRQNGRGARWEAAEEAWAADDDENGKNGIPAKDEMIRLRTPRGFKEVQVGDWIALGEDGNFRSFSATEINENYKEV